MYSVIDRHQMIIFRNLHKFILPMVPYLGPKGRLVCLYVDSIVLLQQHDQLSAPVSVVDDCDPTHNQIEYLSLHPSGSVKEY